MKYMATVPDVVNAFVRDDGEYPGDVYIKLAMEEHMREFSKQRNNGFDVLASSALDNAVELIEKLQTHFSLPSGHRIRNLELQAGILRAKIQAQSNVLDQLREAIRASCRDDRSKHLGGCPLLKGKNDGEE